MDGDEELAGEAGASEAGRDDSKDFNSHFNFLTYFSQTGDDHTFYLIEIFLMSNELLRGEIFQQMIKNLRINHNKSFILFLNRLLANLGCIKALPLRKVSDESI